jgi:hypothetical protein
MMNDADFPHAGLDHPRCDPEIEPAARELHRSPVVVLSSQVPHRIEQPYLEKVGFARIPELTTIVYCKPADVAKLIPIVRQHAFAWLAERGISDEHLRFVPSLSRGERRTLFVDQNGARRYGERNEIRFDLSHMLADAVEWQGSKGALVPTWQLAAAELQAS